MASAWEQMPAASYAIDKLWSGPVSISMMGRDWGAAAVAVNIDFAYPGFSVGAHGTWSDVWDFYFNPPGCRDGSSDEPWAGDDGFGQLSYVFYMGIRITAMSGTVSGQGNTFWARLTGSTDSGGTNWVPDLVYEQVVEGGGSWVAPGWILISTRCTPLPQAQCHCRLQVGQNVTSNMTVSFEKTLAQGPTFFTRVVVA